MSMLLWDLVLRLELDDINLIVAFVYCHLIRLAPFGMCNIDLVIVLHTESIRGVDTGLVCSFYHLLFHLIYLPFLSYLTLHCILYYPRRLTLFGCN